MDRSPPNAELRRLIEAEGYTLETLHAAHGVEVVAVPRDEEGIFIASTHDTEAEALESVWDQVQSFRDDPPDDDVEPVPFDPVTFGRNLGWFGRWRARRAQRAFMRRYGPPYLPRPSPPDGPAPDAPYLPVDLPVKPPRAVELRDLIEEEGFTVAAFDRGGGWFTAIGTPLPGAHPGEDAPVIECKGATPIAAIGAVWDGIRTFRGDPPFRG
ncbi:MAG: hypothetical protein AB7V62_06995 [Thermoleophilia bacterium]